MKDNPLPGSTAKVYCQIVSRDVTAHTCHMTQGQEGCFGCASRHRLCERCKKKIVTIPAIGLCSTCAATARAAELALPPLQVDQKVQVHCQINKFKISGAMCLAQQGDRGCARCPAPTRKCEMCKERAVRFPRYGLCLTCTIKKFGEEVSFIAPAIVRPPVLTSPTLVTQEEPVRSTPNALEVHPEQTPVEVTAAHAETGTRETSGVSTEGEDMEKQKFDDLVARARRLVIKTQKASAGILCEKLRMSMSIAKKVMDELSKQGVIAPNGINRYRKVLMSKDSVPARPKNRASSSSLEARVQEALPAARAHILKRGEAHTRILKELHIGGDVIAEILRRLEDEGFISKRERNAPRKILAARSTKHLSTTVRARIEEVLLDAKALILKEGKTHIRFLKRELRVGDEVAHEVIRRLEEENFMSKRGHGNTRKILGVGTPSSKPSRLENDFTRVLQLIACIGENSELGKELLSLVASAKQLATIKTALGTPR